MPTSPDSEQRLVGKKPVSWLLLRSMVPKLPFANDPSDSGTVPTSSDPYRFSCVSPVSEPSHAGSPPVISL